MLRGFARVGIASAVTLRGSIAVFKCGRCRSSSGHGTRHIVFALDKNEILGSRGIIKYRIRGMLALSQQPYSKDASSPHPCLGVEFGPLFGAGFFRLGRCYHAYGNM